MPSMKSRFGQVIVLMLCVLLIPAPAAADASTADPRARIKRLAIIVPDLDRAHVFFTDVLRFTPGDRGTIDPASEPYLGVVFPSLPEGPRRRALYHTSTEQRGLFVMEVPGWKPAPSGGVLTVVETSDVEALGDRARALGFATAFPVSDVSPEGMVFKELLITGPGNHAFLVYQYGLHEETLRSD